VVLVIQNIAIVYNCFEKWEIFLSEDYYFEKEKGEDEFFDKVFFIKFVNLMFILFYSLCVMNKISPFSCWDYSFYHLFTECFSLPSWLYCCIFLCFDFEFGFCI
jgi:hypothetical protein